MIPIISLFNHKGGVSKTTTAFNLGWAMAERGRRILIVDGDPQCNLTGTVLGFDGLQDFSDFYQNNPNANISEALDPIFKATGAPLAPAIITDTVHPNLFLLAGNIDLAENETQIAVALSTSAAIPALQNIPGSIAALIRKTAKANNIDAVIVDMSPSVGALNQCFLMGSDFLSFPPPQIITASKRYRLFHEYYLAGIRGFRVFATKTFCTHSQKILPDFAESSRKGIVRA